MTQAAIAKRLATIAQEYHQRQEVPRIGAVLIRAGKAGATVKTLAAAAGCCLTDAALALTVLEACGFAHQWTGDVWRVDTVQILARENRAALEALESATRAEKEQAATGIAKRKENAPQAQTGGKNGTH